MSATNEGILHRLTGLEDKIDVVLGWIERQDAMAQAMAATMGEAADRPLDAMTTLADVVGLYSTPEPTKTVDAEPDNSPWDNHPVRGLQADHVIFDELSPSEEVAAGLDAIQNSPTATAAVARMLLRDKDAEMDKRGEYGFDKGYFSAMKDMLRHLNAWEAVSLGQPIAGDDGRYDGFDTGEDMMRQQLNAFFDASEAGWGEEYPSFEEWSA